jgi:predicted lipid-binding transport protein (Tim44 family)
VSDLLKDAEKAVSAVSAASSVASTTESVVGGAVKLVAGAAGGVLTGLMPYLLGLMGAAIIGLAATVSFDHYVTIPHWKAQDAIDKAAAAAANVATQEADQNLDNLRNVVTDDNRKMEAIAHSCMEQDQSAVTAGIRAVTVLPPPPAGQSAAVVGPYWTLMLTEPK